MQKTRTKIVAALALSLMSAGAVAADTSFTARNGGPSQSALVGKSGHSPAAGLAFVRPVLSGVLYRAGFKGGDKERDGLSSGQREELCGAGFSSARYVDFGKNTKYGNTSCSTGKMTYASAKSTSPSEVMQELHGIIKDPGRGPMLVHCMWGVHSSGAISAMALVQFCGWSEERAKAYWNDARNGADCSDGCDAWIDHHFDHFKFNAALTISDAERAAICPK
ncbi:hypothetical protein E7811_15375 [Aliigemmobacter aestuarii]|uniref:Tyrosine specific protein phosphatases domain-containing protein n=1 Tax=Aliigemmobacter aestuarii TaxID=1445661 RepID=A0A4S3MKD3_9RHOB|nr:hypothetical protein [Gemmobacter aestuarii]THD82422.1 hypothetical protein E7811_15375 [Gemmobacter aestuarii]